MEDHIGKAIEKLKKEINKCKTMQDYHLFGLVCYKYFYNEGELNTSDIKATLIDGKGDGGIDLIAVKDNDGYKSMVLVQIKDVSDINKDDIKNALTKMIHTKNNFSNDRIAEYNDKLQKLYLDKQDEADGENTSIELALFLNTKKSDRYKEEIEESLKHVPELKKFDFNIFYKDEINEQIKSLEGGQLFVKYGQVDIKTDDGILKYGDDGIIVNISALSIRKLYSQYKNQGLFEQNFRYYIRNKKIDTGINQSLKNDRERFWFLNNGIIIGCKDFKPDGNNIKLYEFSIINGCQTVSLLGQYKGKGQEEDFSIVCKIVKSSSKNENDFIHFISKIAEASNSQKPIKDRDLKSNRAEQKDLQRSLEEKKVYMEIKRGDGYASKKITDKWQRTNNDKLGQLILGVLLQQPGTARNSKAKIFSDDNIYKKIFIFDTEYNKSICRLLY